MSQPNYKGLNFILTSREMRAENIQEIEERLRMCDDRLVLKPFTTSDMCERSCFFRTRYLPDFHEFHGKKPPILLFCSKHQTLKCLNKNCFTEAERLFEFDISCVNELI